MKEHKILSSYIILLIILIIIFMASVFFTLPIGMMGFYQYILGSIILLMIGIPLFLLGIVLLGSVLIGEIKSFPGYMMKRKKKLTKDGKKNLVNGLFIGGLSLFIIMISLLFLGFGGKFAIASYEDYQYVDNPQTVRLLSWKIEYRRRWSGYQGFLGGNYRLTGYDEKNNEYDFVLGKYPDKVLSYETKEVIVVYYLPHSKVIIKIE